MNKLKHYLIASIIAAAIFSVPVFTLTRAQNITPNQSQGVVNLPVLNTTAGGNYTVAGSGGTGTGNLTVNSLTLGTVVANPSGAGNVTATGNLNISGNLNVSSIGDVANANNLNLSGNSIQETLAPASGNINFGGAIATKNPTNGITGNHFAEVGLTATGNVILWVEGIGNVTIQSHGN